MKMVSNLSSSSYVSATLRANNNTNSASQTYNVYLRIDTNTFQKTTSDAELILTITDPTGAAVTSLSGLTYTTVNGVSGFDITEKTGLVTIASNYAITTTTTKTDTWNLTLTYINLDSDQRANETATFSAEVLMQKETISVWQDKYWNDDFENNNYSYPNTPTTKYNSLDELRSDYSSFLSMPYYIKTTSTEHQSCLYYNNHEFCISANYWEGTLNIPDYSAGTATVTKLQTEMQTALQTNANSCGSDNNYAWCIFGSFKCEAEWTGAGICGKEMNDCTISSNGSAYCWLD